MLLVDTGCSSSVVGATEIRRLSTLLGSDPPPLQSDHLHFRFGPGKPLPSLGRVKFQARVNSRTLTFEASVVDAAVPFLLGRDWLSQHGATLSLDKCVMSIQDGDARFGG